MYDTISHGSLSNVNAYHAKGICFHNCTIRHFPVVAHCLQEINIDKFALNQQPILYCSQLPWLFYQ